MPDGLIVTTGSGRLVQAQTDPFRYFEEPVSRRLRLRVRWTAVKDAASVAALTGASSDLVWLQDRRADLRDTAELIDALRNQFPRAPIVLLDCNGGTYARRFHLLDSLDLYVKGQYLRDLDLYDRPYRDGRIFADHLIADWGLTHDFIGSTPLPRAQRHKLAPGWNLGTAVELHDHLARSSEPIAHASRGIDVMCRVRVHSQAHRDWLTRHRAEAVARVASLAASCKVVASSEPVTRDRFFAELADSRLCVSPFGWSEVCWRDFEAVLCGALLLKPSMEHAITQPDIYRPWATYVPVRWDFADLEEKIDHCLSHPDETEAIAKQALVEYRRYFDEALFVDQVSDILQRLGLSA